MNVSKPHPSLFFLTALGAALVGFSGPGPAQNLLQNIAPEKVVIGDSPPLEFIPAPPLTFFFSGPKRNRLLCTDGSPRGTRSINSGAFTKGVSNRAEGIFWKGLFLFQGFDFFSGWELRRAKPAQSTSFLVLDLNPKKNSFQFPLSSFPRGFVSSKTAVFFHADTPLGDVLFRTDGTTQGTIALHVSKGKLSGLSMLGQKVFFYEQVPSTGKSFFGISDGTLAGTSRFTAPQGVGRGRSGRSFAVLGTQLFFVAKAQGKGSELWVSDGTSVGTKLLKDLWPGAPASKPDQLQVLGKRLFFAAQGPGVGRELWVSDGTAKGTHLFKDLNPGASADGAPTHLVAWGARLVFSAVSAGEGREPWISDGTVKGTRPLADLQGGRPSSNPRAFVPLGKLLYFYASPKARQLALYRSDGTTAGTRLFFNLGLEPKSFETAPLGRVGTKLLFSNRDPLHGEECWVSDGTAKGTQLLIDVLPNKKLPVGSVPRFFSRLGDHCYFTAKVPGKAVQLWTSDGTPKGTVALPVFPLNGSIYPTPSRLLFVQSGPQGQDLMAFDPTTARSSLVHAFGKGIWPLYPFGKRLLFYVGDPSQGRRLWVSDGSPKGTRLFAPLPARPGDSFSEPIPLDAEGKKVIVFGPYSSQGSSSVQVWVSDGTKAGTRVLSTFAPFQPIRFLGLLSQRRVGKDLFLLLHQQEGSQNKMSLWRTDGTPKGTLALTLFDSPSTPSELVDLGGKLFFGAFQKKTGGELWTTDGTPKGTQLFMDLEPGAGSSFPRSLRRIGKRILFFAQTRSKGLALYATDGSRKGTQVLKILKNGPTTGFGNPPSLHPIGSRYLAFTGNSGGAGFRFWISDGTPKGTKPKSPILKNNQTGALNASLLFQGRLFFSWAHLFYGEEPWVWFPGASAQAFGFGCQPGNTPLSLQAQDPVLGKPFSMSGTLDPSFPFGILLLGLPPKLPLHLPLEGDCRLYLDPGKPLLSLPLRAVGKPWTLSTNLPNLPALLGLVLDSQVLQPLPGGKLASSNPVELVLGF